MLQHGIALVVCLCFYLNFTFAIDCEQSLKHLAEGSYPEGIERPRLNSDIANGILSSLRKLTRSVFDAPENQAWEIQQAASEILKQVIGLNSRLQTMGMADHFSTAGLSRWTGKMLLLPELDRTQPALFAALVSLHDNLIQQKHELIFFNLKKLKEEPNGTHNAYRQLKDCLMDPEVSHIAASALRSLILANPSHTASARLEMELPARLNTLREAAQLFPQGSEQHTNLQKAIDVLEGMVVGLLDVKISEMIRYNRPLTDYEPESQPTVRRIFSVQQNPQPLLSIEEAKAFLAAYHNVDVDGTTPPLSDVLMHQALWGKYSLDSEAEERALTYVTILKKTYDISKSEKLKLTADAIARERRLDEENAKLAAIVEKKIKELRSLLKATDLPHLKKVEKPKKTGTVNLDTAYQANLAKLQSRRVNQRENPVPSLSPEQKKQARRTRSLQLIVENDLNGLMSYLSGIRLRNPNFQISTLNLADGRTLSEFSMAVSRPEIAAWLDKEFPTSRR